MTKRISDLSFDELKAEATHAWSAAASRALEAGLKVEGIVQPTPHGEAGREAASRKTGKKRVQAA
jgi:hypothetical protein